MIIGTGVDVCAVARLEAALGRHPGLADRLFTRAEQTLADGSTRGFNSLAGRFAAKEALAKALATPETLAWTDAEVTTGPSGAPVFVLRGGVAAHAEAAGVRGIHLSISHDGGLAVAFVVCEG